MSDPRTVAVKVCGAYLGDNDGTCPQLTCIRPSGHEGLHDNVSAAEGDGRPPITHVAIRFRGRTWSLPPPNRHHHVVRFVADETGEKFIDCRNDDQGFLDASGRYLTREQALVSALLNKQVLDESTIRLGLLFSEDLW